MKTEAGRHAAKMVELIAGAFAEEDVEKRDGKLVSTIRQLIVKDAGENWTHERRGIVRMLRSVCEEFGDNDWPDDLHLADVIDKHLARYLHQPTEQKEHS